MTDPGLIFLNFDGCMRDQSTKSFKQGREEGLGSVEYFFSSYLGIRALSVQNWSISSCFSLLQAIENLSFGLILVPMWLLYSFSGFDGGTFWIISS